MEDTQKKSKQGNINTQNEQIQDEQVDNTTSLDTEQVDSLEDNSLDVINSILDSEKNTEEPSNEEDESIDEPSNEGTSTKSINDIIIDDELINQHSSLKSFKGKPITDLPGYYDNLRRELTKVTQELSQFKKESIKEEIIDPIDDLEGFKLQQSQLKDLTIQEAEKKAEEVAKKVYENKLKEIEETKEAAQKIKDTLKSKLPDGINPEDALNLFKENELMLNGKINEKAVNFYMENPDLFIKHILIETENAVLKENLDNKAKSKAFDILNSNMSKANKSRTKPTKSIIVSNEEPSEVDNIVNEVYNLSYNPNDFPS